MLRLGREERLEHAVEDLGRHAGSRVVHRHQHVVIARPARDGYLTGAARALDRLPGVHHGVEHHLLQLLRVTRHGGDVVGNRYRGADARCLERAALQREHAVRDLAQVHGRLLARPLAGEVEQGLDDATGAHRFAPNHLGALLQVRLMWLQGKRLAEGGDRSQRIIELVRHARHQGAEL